jgi:hypothetical protein
MEELHVPLILSNPRLFAPGGRCGLFTQQPDLAPTIAGLVGVPPDEQWLGRNLAAPRVPLRAFPVKVEQAKLGGIVDNGLVFRLDEKSSRSALMRIDGEQLSPLDPGDPRLKLAPAYADRLGLFTPWVRWRHFRRVVNAPATAAK